MAAARPRMTTEDGGGAGEGEEPPLPFRQAVAALAAARLRPEVTLSPLPAPRRLAPFAHALAATVAPAGAQADDEEEPEELADGRFVLLYDPAGQEPWQGTFRVVTLGRTELEPEMAGDPLLPEVAWTWLTGALEARGAAYTEPSGTVTRSGSYHFGGLGDRPTRTELEVRASWTPGGADTAVAAGPEDVPDVAAHLAAWCELLCQCAGLPPEPSDGNGGGGASVVPLPQRRGPQPL